MEYSQSALNEHLVKNTSHFCQFSRAVLTTKLTTKYFLKVRFVSKIPRQSRLNASGGFKGRVLVRALERNTKDDEDESALLYLKKMFVPDLLIVVVVHIVGGR